MEDRENLKISKIQVNIPFTIGFATILYTLCWVALGLNTLSYTNTLPCIYANKNRQNNVNPTPLVHSWSVSSPNRRLYSVHSTSSCQIWLHSAFSSMLTSHQLNKRTGNAHVNRYKFYNQILYQHLLRHYYLILYQCGILGSKIGTSQHHR